MLNCQFTCPPLSYILYGDKQSFTHTHTLGEHLKSIQKEWGSNQQSLIFCLLKVVIQRLIVHLLKTSFIETNVWS